MTHAHFIEWLRSHLDNKSFGGCRWIERSEQTFKISWPRADRTTMRDADTTRELLGIMYGWWTHKFGNTRINDQPTAIKGNFRSCLNSKVQSLEIRKVVRLNETTEADTWKAYQFTEPRDKKGTPGKGKKHTSSVSSSAYRDTEMTGFEADIETDSQWPDTSPYEPHECYAERVLLDQIGEINMGLRNWVVEVKAYRKGDVNIATYDYNFVAESLGENKLLVYFKGAYYENDVYNITAIRVPNFASLPLSMFAVPPKQPMEYDKMNMSIADHMCPGFLLEVDAVTFDIYITRLSSCHLYYGCITGADRSGTWIKLDALKKPDAYHSGTNGVRQKIFSYGKFLHRTEIYRRMLVAQEQGIISQPLIERIDPQVYISVGTKPSLELGIRDCDYYFIVTHKLAQQLYNSFLCKTGQKLIVSDDMVVEKKDTVMRYLQFSEDLYTGREPTLSSYNNEEIAPPLYSEPTVMGPPAAVPPPSYYAPDEQEPYDGSPVGYGNPGYASPDWQ